jgi:solute carrier family 25 (mitochondrial iron transporter), member 28/37
MVDAFKHIHQTRGLPGFFFGVRAAAVGAAPSHAAYFAAYELFLSMFGARQGSGADSFLGSGFAGAFATLTADAIQAPMDVVKQRMQLSRRVYLSTQHAFVHVLRHEGFRGLFAGYNTTLAMNVPFHFVFVSVYEKCRYMLVSDEETGFQGFQHILAGGIAGATAAAITTPLDVVRTRLQTRGDTGRADSYTGLVRTISVVMKEEGPRALVAGMMPRMWFFVPSSAIVWTTYEALKYLIM